MLKTHWLIPRGCFVAMWAIVGFASPVHADLVAFWSGNGNANDSIGGNNGMVEGGTSYAPGLFGEKAFQFNGSGFVAVPNVSSSAYNFGSNPFSIAVWANFNSINSAGLPGGGNVLVGDDNGGGQQNKWFFSYLSNGQLGFHVNSSSGAHIDFKYSSTFTPVSTGTWDLFAVTKSGDTFSFYVNGTSVGSAVDPNYSTIPSVSAPLTIGQAEGIGYVNGLLQDVRIYNQALTADQVYSLAHPSSVPEPSTLVLLGLGVLGLIARCRRSVGI